MINIRYLLSKFDNEFKVVAPNSDWQMGPNYIELLEPQDRYTADRVYLIGAHSQYPKTSAAEPGSIFMFCDGVEAPVPHGTTGIYLKAPLARVYNTCMQNAVLAKRWENELQNHSEEADFQSLVTQASLLGDCFTLHVGMSGRVMANWHTHLEGSITQRVSLNDIARMITQSAKHRENDEDAAWSMETEAGTTLWCAIVKHPDDVASVVAMEDISGDFDIETLCILTAETLGSMLLSESMAAMNAEMQVFCRCWQDIMDRKQVTNDEVRDALSRMPYPVQDFVSLGVITFPRRRSEIPYRDILIQIRRLFPYENITLYEHDILILLSQKERSFRPNFTDIDTEHLSNLLKQHDGMMAISAKTRRVDALPSFYYLAKRTALLAMALHDAPSEKRIVYYEDYSIYCIIDLAVKQYLQNPVNNDVVYLVHSAIIQLTRYDAEHHTNLRDVLYHYLICDRNLVKTSAATFMHRNTVLNKINKITSLLDLDLEDPVLRQKLILSCQIILYIERAMNCQLNM